MFLNKDPSPHSISFRGFRMTNTYLYKGFWQYSLVRRAFRFTPFLAMTNAYAFDILASIFPIPGVLPIGPPEHALFMEEL